MIYAALAAAVAIAWLFHWLGVQAERLREERERYRATLLGVYNGKQLWKVFNETTAFNAERLPG